MIRPSEPVKFRRVKVRALQPRYFADGKIVQVGDVHEMDISDATHLVLAQKAEIIGEAKPGIVPMSDIRPSRKERFATRW